MLQSISYHIGIIKYGSFYTTGINIKLFPLIRYRIGILNKKRRLKKVMILSIKILR
jgi:hypothetical protein